MSQAGIRMYQIAVVWWILQQVKGGSGVTIGAFLVLGAIPALLFVKIIGQFIDRFSSKKILISCDLAGFLVISAVLILIQQESVALISVFIAQFFLSSFQSTIDPTISKAVPELVPEQDIERAVAFQTSTQSIANFGGAVLGALLLDFLGIKGVIILNACAYLVSIFCTYLIQFKYAIPKTSSQVEGKESAWMILNRLPGVKKILFGFGFINFFSTPTLVILPLYTMKTLNGSASLLGSLEAYIWAGLLIGSFSTRLFSGIKNTLLIGTLCLFILGLCLFIPGLFINQNLYSGALFIGHFMLGVNNVKFVSLFQEIVPASYKGRFFAIFQAIITFTFPVAFFFFGFLGDFFTPQKLCLLQGFGIMVISFYFFKLACLRKTGDKSLAEVS